MPTALIVAFMLSLQASQASAAPASSDDSESPAPLPWQSGPFSLALGHGVSLRLPAEYQFLGQPQAGQQGAAPTTR